MSQFTAPSANELLNHNVRRQIDNPLRHHTLDGLERLARNFAHHVDAVDTNDDYQDAADKVSPNQNLFISAAHFAYDPPNRNVIGTPEERQLLKKGKQASFWSQPRPLQVTVVSLCLSAMTQGYCQSILSGANQTMPEEFGLKDQDNNWKDRKSLWIFAALNAVTYLTAGLLGCWVADPLQSTYLGRRGAILFSALVCLASLIGCSFTHSWKELMIARAFLGFALGAKASVTPIFCAEVSPSHLRGALVFNWQFFDALGIFLGFAADLVLSSTGILSWRLQTASACIPAACLILLIWTVPESPRWLLKRGEYGRAFASMCTLRHSPLEAAVELLYANEQVQIEIELLPPGSIERTQEENTVPHSSRFQNAVASTNYWIRIWQLFRNKGTRRAAVAAGVVMLAQILCGINVVCFYGTTFFRDINGMSSAAVSTKALWMSFGVGLANWIFTLPAYYLGDSKGRKFLLLLTYPGMILAMLGACLSFLCNDEQTKFILVCFFMFVFVFFYSFGQGPVAFAYASEVFPLLNREAGMSFSVFVNLTGAGLLTLFLPQAQATPNLADTRNSEWNKVQITLLAIFTGLNIVSLLLICLFVPETAGTTVRKEEDKLHYMSLEELKYIFGVPTPNRIKYQFQYVIPNAWEVVKYHIGAFFRRNPEENESENDDVETEDTTEDGVEEDEDGQGVRRRRAWRVGQEVGHFPPRLPLMYDWEPIKPQDIIGVGYSNDSDVQLTENKDEPEHVEAIIAPENQMMQRQGRIGTGRERDQRLIELLREVKVLLNRELDE